MRESSVDHFFVSEEEEGERLDKVLATRFPHHSRTYFQFLIENGSVLVNGVLHKKRTKLCCDDEIEVCFLLTPEISLSPENIPLDILYEDEHLLAINKPIGMVVHPAPGHPSHTFVNALLYHCQLENKGESLRPGIVHRLDKDTSGVLLAAKTASMHAQLVSLFSQRQIEKHYLAICLGNPGDGVIDAPIGRHPVHRKQMAVCPEKGKEAISQCKVLAEKGGLSLVEVKPLTGRTHQIRVHLKMRKTPVLGDSLYGSSSANQKYGVHRQLLHAYRLRFMHPEAKKWIELKAPPPKDFVSFFLVD